jgi:PRTRC genetic system ThiF family protein
MTGPRTFPIPPRWIDHPIRILLVGAGGTGSQIADQLASLDATLRRLGHPGFEVIVADGDRISASNVGRQRFTAADIGLPKANVLVHRINLFYGLDWRASVRYVSPRERIAADLLITAVDKAAFRAQLAAHYRCRTTDTLWADTGNGDVEGQVILGHLGKPPGAGDRLPNILDLHAEIAHDTDARDADGPSCSIEEAVARQAWPINRLVAQALTDLLWTLIRHGSIAHHGYRVSACPAQIVPLPIDPLQWAMLGYAPRRRRRLPTNQAA